MSWSINLSGPKKVVTRELVDAALLLDSAIEWASNSDANTVTVQIGGYVSWNDEEEVTSSNVSFSVGESFTTQK